MREKILQLVDQVIDELNLQLDRPIELTEGIRTRLFGRGGILDSLMLVSLIVALEQEIQDAFDVDVALMDERALSMTRSPYESVASLVDYACQLIREPK